MNTAIITAVIVAALSFICQKTLGNLIYGFVILVTKPFKKGDKITITQVSREIASGRVIGIGPLHVRIKRYDRDVISIPNSLLEVCVIENSDYKARINYTTSVKITLDSDYKLAKDIIRNILIQHLETYNNEDNTNVLYRINEGGIELSYNVRSKDIDASFEISSEVCELILEEFAKHANITLM